MANLIRTTCAGLSDPRSPEFWDEDARPLSRIVVRFSQTWSGWLWTGFVSISNIICAVLYVMMTESTVIVEVKEPFDVSVDQRPGNFPDYESMNTALYIFSWVFLVDFIKRICGHSDRWSFLFKKVTGMLYLRFPTKDCFDLAAIVVVQVSHFAYTSLNESNARWDLLVFVNVRILYFADFLLLMGPASTEKKGIIQQRSASVLIHFVAVMLVGASLFYHIENWSDDRVEKLEWFQCVYYMIVTTTTVGYGDISPTAFLGRLYVIFLMLYVVVVQFPAMIDACSDLCTLTQYNTGEGAYSDQPVIFWQNGHCPSVKVLRIITKDLFRRDDTMAKVSLCIVADCPPKLDVQLFMDCQKQKNKNICYIEGDLRDKQTCDRAGVTYAKACLLMCRTNAISKAEEIMQDEEVALMAICLRQYVHDACSLHDPPLATHPLKLVLMAHSAHNLRCIRDNYWISVPDCYSDSLHSLSLRSCQFAALAKNVRCPGFIPFLMNLLGTSSGSVDGHLPEWQQLYETGVGMSLYGVSLPESLQHVSMARLAELTYCATNAVLIPGKNGSCNVICSDLSAANKCQEYLNSLVEQSNLLNSVASQEDNRSMNRTWDDDLMYKDPEIPPPRPITKTARDKLRVSYETLGLDIIHGPIDQFCLEHVVVDPVDRVRKYPLKLAPGSPLALCLRKHVLLVTSTLHEVADFVCILRSVTVAHIQDILIITSQGAISSAMEEILSIFPGVYVLLVPSILAVTEQHLVSIGIPFASHLVLKASTTGEGTKRSGDENHLLHLALIAQREAKYMETDHGHQKLRVMLELRDMSLCPFSEDGSEESNAFHLEECCSHMSPSSSSLVSGVSSGQLIHQTGFLSLSTACVFSNREWAYFETFLGRNPELSLNCEQVDPNCVGMTFKELVVSYCASGLVPVAIYRVFVLSGSETTHRAIITNPSPETKMQEDDLIYSWSQPTNQTGTIHGFAKQKWHPIGDEGEEVLVRGSMSLVELSDVGIKTSHNFGQM